MEIKEVFASVTTVPLLDELPTNGADFERFRSTYVDIKEYVNDRQVVQGYQESAGRSLAFAKISHITVGYELDGEIRTNTITGEEKYIIMRFHELLSGEFFQNARLYGYNLEYLYSMVNFRGRANKVPLELEAPQFKDIANQPWNRKKSTDLMDLVSRSHKFYVSLINALYGAGLSYKGILDKNDFYGSTPEELQLHCGASVSGCINLFRFLCNEDEIVDITFGVEEAQKPEEKKVGVLDQILGSGQLTSRLVDAVAQYTKEQELDPESVLELVKAAISKNRDYQNVKEEDYIELEEALGLSVDYSMIQCVVDKGNMGKKECDLLVKQYGKSDEKTKKEVVHLAEQFLTSKGKMEQKRAKEAFELLKKELDV